MAIIIAALPLAVYLLGKPLRPNEAAQGIYRSLGERLPTNAVILTDRPLEVAWYAKRRAVWLCQYESDLPVIEKATGPVTAVFVTPLIRELPIKEWGDWWSRIILPHGVYRGMWPSEAFGTQFIFRQRLDTAGAASELDLLMREVANTPDSAEAHTQLAVAYLMREQLQEAVREFEEAIRLDDNNTQALLGLWQAKARISEPPETLSLSQLALQTTPNDANSVAVLERAIRYFNTLLQQNRDNPWLLLNVAMCQARLKNWEAVEAAYHGLSRLAPKTFPPDLLMVNLYLQQGLIQEAALGCERLIKSKVALPTAYQLLGSIYSSTGKLPEALEAFKTAIELRPQSSAAYQQAARVCFLLGRNADAAQLLLDALRVVPRSSAVRFDLAKIRLSENDTNKAILIYEDILRDYPDHPVALNNIAELLARSNKLKRALELAARATRVYPNNPAIQDTYGWILYLSDQPAEALKHLREAVRLAPAMGIAHYHLGKVLIANGQEQNGADALRVALAQGLPRIEEADADSIVKVH
ncbi:MAG: tetratricopeptide repeat protein [Verrucomicrobiota bacterium]